MSCGIGHILLIVLHRPQSSVFIHGKNIVLEGNTQVFVHQNFLEHLGNGGAVKAGQVSEVLMGEGRKLIFLTEQKQEGQCTSGVLKLRTEQEVCLAVMRAGYAVKQKGGELRIGQEALAQK